MLIRFRVTTQIPLPQIPLPTSRSARFGRRRFVKRGGSVLVIVISLMGLLLLAGITFITFSSQENVSAEYYADAAKEYTNPSLDTDDLFDFGLRQLIVGPSNTEYNSALFGRRQAMLTNMLGFANDASHWDAFPYNGQGITLYDANDNGVPDNGGGTPTDSLDSVRVNYSYGALGSATVAPGILSPSADVEYTAPDVNNMFLAYKGQGLQLDGSGNIANERKVIIPSFHRPQYLRNPSGGAPIADWYSNQTGATNTTRILFRPHPAHMAVKPDGSMSTYTRFLSSSATVGARTVNAFPFAVDADGDGNYGEQGVWSAPTLTTNDYEYDADNDGDGTKEGVWIDLDFADQELPDGRRYVPLFSFTVYDADGLLPLNVAGNFSGLADLNHPLGDNAFMSRSNLGMSRSEINPLWALYADPNSTNYVDASDKNSVLEQYRVFWQLDPGSSDITRTTMANMDLLHALWGRAHFTQSSSGVFNVSGLGRYDADDYYTGRWGEIALLQAGVAAQATTSNPALFPRPGTTNFDDDGDQYAARPFTVLFTNAFNGTYSLAGSAWPGTYSAGFHPLDFLGNGHSYNFANPTGLTGLMATPGGGGPTRWLGYDYGYQNPSNYGVVGYNTYLDAGLLTSSLPDSFLLDEPDEVVAEPSLKNANDDIYDYSEMIGLHLRKSDFSTAGGTSRLQQLLSFNFRDNKLAEEIREQFTTASFDRVQFSQRQSAYRTWESNYDDPTDPDANFSFPPVFVTPPGSDASSSAYIGLEPFRPVLRSRLFVEQNDTHRDTGNVQFAQALRLRLNEVLYAYDTTTGEPMMRPLTPHICPPGYETSTITSGDIVDPGVAASYTQGTVIPTTAGQQEFLARKDRQLLARDIYVLLYTLGGGNDSQNYTLDNSGRTIYSDVQLTEMAQFAVNYVDALDPDNVITRFEYDKNLDDGWNLDDDPDTDPNIDPMCTDSTSDRGTVFGVEAQQLTFSEGLAIYTKQMASDHNATLFKDTDGDHYHMFLELRSVSPLPVNLNPIPTSNTGVWRLRRPDPIDPTGVTTLASVVFQSGAGSVAAGDKYTIGAQDGTDTFSTGQARPSDFRVDYAMDASTRSYPRIVPAIPDTGTIPSNTTDFVSFPAPGCNLDLVHQSHASKFSPVSTTAVPPTGGFMAPLGAATSYTVILERRAHPGLPELSVTDNPWVEVDRITFNTKTFGLSITDTTQALVTAQLTSLVSTERSQPFSRQTETNYNTAASDGLHYNTIGTAQNSTAATSEIWQPHFDRNFASIYEIMDVPLFAPSALTSSTGLAPGNPPKLTGQYTAAIKFLQPQHPSNIPVVSSVMLDNRWHRLFEFVEVPTRTELSVRGLLPGPRLPGAVNLNTIRHRGVLGGLIDDYFVNPLTGAQVGGHLNMSYASGSPWTMLQDNYESRDWWVQFLRSRDGIDPVSGLVLPGLATSKPFRSLAYLDDGVNSIEHTILRSLPSDGDIAETTAPAINSPNHSNNRRRLFEARTLGDWTTNAVDPHTRHRLLRKIANNTTTRSNVFIVYMSVEFFEAVKQNDGSIQIGSKLEGSSGHRGFFIIDRSLPEQAFSDTGTDFDYSTFNFRQFVKFQKTIQ